MKRSLGFIISFAVLLLAVLYLYRYYHAKTYGEKMPYKEVGHYYIKRDIPLEDGVNYFIIENAGEFNYLFDFIPADKKTDRPAQIAFGKELVIALVYHNIDPRTTIRTNRVTMKGGNLHIDYRINDSKMNIAVATQEKTFNQIEQKKDGTAEPSSFYVDMSEIISIKMPTYYLDLYISENGKPWPKIALGRRRLGSPETYEQFIENYLGTFKGTLPCADCPGIKTELTLEKDHYYTLKTTYQGKNSKSFTERGRWDISEDLAIIGLLNPQSPNQTYYLIDDKDNLELLDKKAKPINTDANLIIKRDKKAKGK